MIKTKVKNSFDMSEWNKIVKKMTTLDGYVVETGYHADQIHPEHDLSLSYIAYVNNFGDEDQNIPARPFMDFAAQWHDQELEKKAPQLVQMYFYQDKKLMPMLREVGNRGKALIEIVIDWNQFTPNAPKTLAVKEGSTPLVDSGYMKKNAKIKIYKD